MQRYLIIHCFVTETLGTVVIKIEPNLYTYSFLFYRGKRSVKSEIIEIPRNKR